LVPTYVHIRMSFYRTQAGLTDISSGEHRRPSSKPLLPCGLTEMRTWFLRRIYLNSGCKLLLLRVCAFTQEQNEEKDGLSLFRFFDTS